MFPLEHWFAMYRIRSALYPLLLLLVHQSVAKLVTRKMHEGDIDPECTVGIHFRVPALWPMFRQVTVYEYNIWRINTGCAV